MSEQGRHRVDSCRLVNGRIVLFSGDRAFEWLIEQLTVLTVTRSKRVDVEYGLQTATSRVEGHCTAGRGQIR